VPRIDARNLTREVTTGDSQPDPIATLDSTP